MTGNEEGKQDEPKIVSDNSQSGVNERAASAIPLGDLTCVSQDAETSSARKDIVEETEELNSAGVIKLPEERDQLASEGPDAEAVGCIASESLHDPSEDVTKNLPIKDILRLPETVGGSNATGNSSCHMYAELNRSIGCSSETQSNDPSRTFSESGLGLVEVEVIDRLTGPLISQPPNLAVSVEPVFEGLEIRLEDGTNCLVTEQFELPVEVVSNLHHLETPAGKQVAKNFERTGRRDKRNTTRVKKNYTSRPSLGNKRSLRLRTGKKSKNMESNSQTGNSTAGEESNHTQRKKKRTRKVTADEYLSIRKNLRYMLNRIGYERSLIDAYSSEGWKGLSLEKLKPEKELQRATSEIVRRKLKIRDLFQRLDSMCAEGRLPEALFDEDGMIASEDIFCAKCGSKDLTLDNDIILCDGACERGFHQLCLEPPLLKEDIPPGDEGWLCPGCDCKVDCLDMLNESQGTNLSITDSWEKVFPEAVKAVNHDPTSGISSDDSEDEDFDPDRPQAHGKVSRNESSSDESEYATASDNSAPQPKDNQYLGLPSDDSEDDEYDPDAPNPDAVKEESSSSDFTSDSEDLEAALVDDPHGSKGVPKPSSTRGRSSPKRKSSGTVGKKQATHDQLQSLSESEPGESGAPPVSARRIVERLDYKKLHDETYGGTSSDSSDDEDWTDTLSPRKRKRSDEDEKQQKEWNDENVTRTRGRRKSGASTPAAAKPTGAKNQSSSSRKLGEAVKKRLYESFNLNQYPDRATKERLAAELGMTCVQVDKWFGNARWSFNHPSGRKSNVPRKNVKDTASLPQADSKLNEEILPNGVQNAGIPEGNVSLPGSSEKQDERGKKLLEQNEEPNNRKGSTPGNEKDKANKAPVE